MSVGPSTAGQIPHAGSEFQSKIDGFAGGANLRDAPTQLADDEALAIRNVILDERGGAQKRAGTTGLVTLPGNIISAAIFYRTNGQHQLVVHCDDGSLRYSTNWDGGAPTFTSIAVGKSTTDPYSFETYLDRLYMSNGTNSYAKWDGTTFTEMAANPKGKYLRLWKDAMWVSGVPGLENRIYSSNVGDADTYGASSWVDIFKGDGDQVTALQQDPTGQSMVVFKQRRTFFIYDPVAFANRLADPEKGCESHFSTVFFKGELYFLSALGICVYNGSGAAEVVSINIDPVFSPAILNYNALNLVSAYATPYRVGFCVPEAGQTKPNLQIELYPILYKRQVDLYSRVQRHPVVFQRMPASFIVVGRKAGNIVMLGASNTGNKKLYKLFDPNSGTDDGTPFNAEIQIGWFDFDSPLLQKYIRRITLGGRGKFEIQWLRNFQSGVYKSHFVDLSASSDKWDSANDIWGSGTWGPDSIDKAGIFSPDVYGKWLAIRIIDAESGVGTRNIDVGGNNYSVTQGEWALYSLVIQGRYLGDFR